MARSRASAKAASSSLKSFYVCLSEGPSAGGHLITDAMDSLEAAMLFAERWGPEGDEGEGLRVQVIDGFTGERSCFTLDLGTGEIGPC